MIQDRQATDRLIHSLLSRPWAITEAKLQELLGLLEMHGNGVRLSEDEAEERFGVARKPDARQAGQIAIIPVYGTIFHRANLFSSYSGGTALQLFCKNFQAALSNEDVSHIVLDIDSPGGSVSYLEEAARMVYKARGRKPIIAVANTLMASAAYYLGSQADELVVTPSGDAGSIGVFMIHADYSEMARNAGVKHTIIKAGKYKAEAHPYAPLSDEALAHLQESVDDCYDMFVKAVARGRDVKESAVRSGFGEGQCLSARRCVQEGMADRVASIDEVLEELQSGRGGRKRQGATVITPAGGSATVAHPAFAGGLLSIPGPTSTLEVSGLAPSAGPILRINEDGVFQAVLYPSGSPLVSSDEEPEERPLCDVCGDELLEDGDCPTCDAGDREDEEEQATNDRIGGGAPAAAEPSHPASPALEARGDTMSHQDTAATAPGAASAGVDAAIAAERQRQRELRALARDHQMTEGTAEEWVEAGLSVEQANTRVAEHYRAQQAVRAAGAQPSTHVGVDREGQRPFASLGEQLLAIRNADAGRGRPDPRLHGVMERQGAASGSSTNVPSDGGWLIQQDFTQGIVSEIWEEGMVLSRVNKVPIGANSNGLVRNRLNEKSRKDGGRYGGVRVYRAAEAHTVEASKPQLRRQQILLEKLMGIYYATEETMQDATALTAEATKCFRSELTFVAENELFRGTGDGEALGIYAAPKLLVVVPKESGQAASTVVIQNVAKMLARLPSRSFRTAAWYVNPAVLPALITMTLGNQPVFLPGGNAAGAPFGTLFGLPIFPVEYCEALGAQGDIGLFDWDQYTAIDKGGINEQQSIHVRFLYDETTFKITYRFNGQPDWEESIEPFKGQDKISPFITLAERS